MSDGRNGFSGVKVFSATMQRDRDALGEKVTAWRTANASLDVVDVVVTQSSDEAFHCITITVFYRDAPVAAKRAARQAAQVPA